MDTQKAKHNVKQVHTPTPSDIAMLSIAVGDALASVWGENDPSIDKVVRAVNAYERDREVIKNLMRSMKKIQKHLRQEDGTPEAESTYIMCKLIQEEVEAAIKKATDGRS